MKKIAFILALVLLFTGCGLNLNNNSKNKTETTTSSKPKGPFKAFYTMEIDDFTPGVEKNAEQKMILRNIHEGIYKIDTNGRIVPGIGKNISVSADDGCLVYDIELRENLKFHDGTSLEPEDIQYSLFRMAGLIEGVDTSKFENHRYWRNLLDGSEEGKFKKGRVELINDNKVVLYLDDFYGVKNTSAILADTFIVPRNYPEESHKDRPIGLGQFSFVQLKEDGFSLAKFDSYHGQKPDISNVEFKKIDSKEERVKAFEKGELNILDSYPGRDKGGKLGLDNSAYSLVFNLKNEVYQQKILREIISLSINKDRIKSDILEETGEVLHSPLGSLMKESLGEYELKSEYDPERGKALVEENPNLKELELSLGYIEEDFLGKVIGEFLVQDLKSVGLNVNLNPIKWNTFKDSVVKNKDYEMVIYRYSGSINPYLILDRFNTYSLSNLSGFSLERYDHLLGHDKENFVDMLEILKNEIPEIPIVDPGVSYKTTEGYGKIDIYPFSYLDIGSIRFQ